MKISVFLITALVLNTSFLFAEPLSALVQGISIWFFVILELLLLIGYLLHKWIVSLSKDFMLEIGYLDAFVIKDGNKAKTQ